MPFEEYLQIKHLGHRLFAYEPLQLCYHINIYNYIYIHILQLQLIMAMCTKYCMHVVKDKQQRHEVQKVKLLVF